MFNLFDLNEQQINLLESIHVPNTYWKNRSVEYQYWFRSLLHKIDSSITFNGLPDEWSNDFFMFCLWSLGYVVIFKSDRNDLAKYGNILFQPCTLSGYDFYYQPNLAIVANPIYDNRLKLGKNAELLKLTPDFRGIFDILDFYSSKLAEISKGIDVGLINTKLPLILSASNDAQAETLKKVYDKVQAGESLVICKDLLDSDELIPRKDPFESWNQDFKQTYIVHNLIEDMGLILDSFYTEIGLPVAIEKKERLVTSEADFASAQSQARISCWMETIRESLDKINKMFNTKITCEVAYERKDDINRNGEDSERPI